MQSFEALLAGLRGTLLAACGVGTPACTPAPPQPTEPEPELEAPTPVFAEQEPEPEQPPDAPLCPDPTPLLTSTGENTGYVRCADGAINRQRATSCAVPVTAPACEGTEVTRSCDTAADCTKRPHGFCASGFYGNTYCHCVYPCTNDSDCGADEACVCPELEEDGLIVAQCGPAECKVNADCASGECGASIRFDGCGHHVMLRCRGSDDTCRNDEGCKHGDCSAFVNRDEWLPFECKMRNCRPGRPLTVEDGVRVASVEQRRWGATNSPNLSPELGRAAYWLDVARMEHASVASFARFAHELLCFGAPPRLLADALVAAADEVRHAEQTFAIASAYADRPLGPGALQVTDLCPTDDPEQFVTRLIIEGCVNETLGVTEALALLAGPLDPLLRPYLEQIAADETRHAALAWRALAWFAPRVDPAVIERAFDRAIASAEKADDEVVDPRHGRLGRDVKRYVRAIAIASVIEQCRHLRNRSHNRNIAANTDPSYA